MTLYGRQIGQFAHDWRVVPPDTWLKQVTARAQEADASGRGDGGPPMAGTAAPVVVLSQSLFERAVKEALRQLGDLSLLAANPLARSRLVQNARAQDEPAEQVLRRLLCEAAAALGEHPRNLKFQRAVELTYLHPVGSQEAVAERLGLAFNTYRYQLATGIERISDALWRREIQATPGP